MGTINYGRSDYITLGYNCNNIDYEEYEYSGEIIAELYETIEYILKDYRFYYFHVAIKPGYYEGFYIDIEHNFSYCYDDYREKIDAQKEITLIKKNSCYLVSMITSCAPFFRDGLRVTQAKRQRSER